MFSMTETLPGGMMVHVGKYQIPLKSAKIVLKREGPAFWDYLEKRDIPATIFKVPTNFPPSASSQRTLSGMGTPDIMGGYGVYSLYTSDENEAQADITPNNAYYAYINENDVMEGQIEGPKNDLVKDGENVVVPFKVYVDNKHKTARIDIQGKEVLIAEKEYSDWVEIEFSMISHLASVTGMVRFYLMEMGDKFRLYVSPTHISPRTPAVPISTPSGYSRELADKVGLFHTIGLPADTKALSQGTFSMENYIHQSLSVFDESCRLFDYELQRFSSQKQALLFFYFSSLDQGQHMFWALNDKEHPYYHPEESRRFAYITDEMYRKFDRVLGKALQKHRPRRPRAGHVRPRLRPLPPRRERQQLPGQGRLPQAERRRARRGSIDPGLRRLAGHQSLRPGPERPLPEHEGPGKRGLRHARRAAQAAGGDQGQAGVAGRPQERPEGHLLRLHLRGQFFQGPYRPRPGHHPGLRPRLPHQRRLRPGHARQRDDQGQHELVVGRPLRRPQEGAGVIHLQLQDPENRCPTSRTSRPPF